MKTAFEYKVFYYLEYGTGIKRHSRYFRKRLSALRFAYTLLDGRFKRASVTLIVVESHMLDGDVFFTDVLYRRK